ncbi:MAG: heme oxygenase (biliverdin-producing), partial [Nannocystaceae bacterium]
VVAPLVLPELWRRQALQADLRALTGSREPPRPSLAVQAYCQRLRKLGQHDPTRLVAHAYTRYLGDLAGGRILGRIVGRALDLQPGSGLDFYQFPTIDDLPAYRDTYRKRLDALPIAPAQVPAIVAEAREAFACNMAVFAEFEGSALKGLLHFVKGRRRRKHPGTVGVPSTGALA